MAQLSAHRHEAARSGTNPDGRPQLGYRQPVPRALPWLFVAALLGCGEPAAPDAGTPDRDASPVADAGRDASAPDAGPDAQPPPADTAVVAHPRELRGAWIATVWNINWPSRTGLSAAAQRAELEGLFDAARASGLNAIFLQIRAESDAFYDSPHEPWSRFLTGTQGADPGYDPLAFAIEAAHARGLELHAWLNPYRALTTSDTSVASAGHVVNARPGMVRRYGNYHWIDPGSDEGLAHTLTVIRDVLERYDVDGIHFDDYFYPYPESGWSFDDDATYAAYRSGGGALERDDWRRENVHRMVRAVHELVESLRPDVRFGISPFGIYRPGMPEGIRGLDPYDALFADPMRWMQEGWLDYVAPQLYWPTTRSGQAYDRLLAWWADRAAEHGRTLFIGNYTAQLGSATEWSVEELRTQVSLTQAEPDAAGNIHYHIEPLDEDRLGFASMLADEFYARPAATPALVDATGAVPTPLVTVDGADVTVTGPDDLRHFAAYREQDGAWRLERLVPAATATFTLWRGRWAISAIDRAGLESLGRTVEVEVGDPPTDPPPPAGASCVHSFGGRYAHTACSASYQCCDGAWRMIADGCGGCLCVEETGETGCGD